MAFTPLELLAELDLYVSANGHLRDGDKVSLSMELVRGLADGFDQLITIAREAHHEVGHLNEHLAEFVLAEAERAEAHV